LVLVKKADTSLPTKFKGRTWLPPAVLEVITPTALKVWIFLEQRKRTDVCTIVEICSRTRLTTGTVSKALSELILLDMIDYEESRSPLGYREGFLYRLREPSTNLPRAAYHYYDRQLHSRQKGIQRKRNRLKKLRPPI
jgi:hypothetical protein